MDFFGVGGSGRWWLWLYPGSHCSPGWPPAQYVAKEASSEPLILLLSTPFECWDCKCANTVVSVFASFETKAQAGLKLLVIARIIGTRYNTCFLIFIFLETESYYVVQSGLQRSSLLPPAQVWKSLGCLIVGESMVIINVLWYFPLNSHSQLESNLWRKQTWDEDVLGLFRRAKLQGWMQCVRFWLERSCMFYLAKSGQTLACTTPSTWRWFQGCMGIPLNPFPC